VIPFAETGARYRNIFTGEIVMAENYKNATALKLSEVFSNSPAVLLERVYT
jgi:(1->4)-alpha-D-glucan 1-alpha-D-glucosylmutase